MRNYVNFRGRARRREFWMFTLFNTLVYLFFWRSVSSCSER